MRRNCFHCGYCQHRDDGSKYYYGQYIRVNKNPYYIPYKYDANDIMYKTIIGSSG